MVRNVFNLLLFNSSGRVPGRENIKLKFFRTSYLNPNYRVKRQNVFIRLKSKLCFICKSSSLQPLISTVHLIVSNITIKISEIDFSKGCFWWQNSKGRSASITTKENFWNSLFRKEILFSWLTFNGLEYRQTPFTCGRVGSKWITVIYSMWNLCQINATCFS